MEQVFLLSMRFVAVDFLIFILRLKVTRFYCSLGRGTTHRAVP